MELETEIKRREIENDGRTVHVYFEPIKGLYMAFGLSAYYITMATDAILSYSDVWGMPVAMMTRRQLHFATQSMTLVEKQEGNYWRLRTRSKIGDAGYERWKNELKKE